MSDLFRTRDHVPDFDRYVASYAERSAATRARLPMRAGIAYGPEAGETLDLFLPPPGRATGAVHIFIHGGYWRMFAKEDFSFVAETVTAAGAIAVIVDYALMPSVRLETSVAQVRRARDWVVGRIAAHGGDPARLTISGHSAGAQLGAMLLDDSQPPGLIQGALLLSGIYDLEPLQRSFLQELIGLTREEVRDFSPLSLTYAGEPVVKVLVGARETAPFHHQAAKFAAHLTTSGIKASTQDVADGDHMSVVADLGTPGTVPAQALTALLAPSGA